MYFKLFCFAYIICCDMKYSIIIWGDQFYYPMAVYLYIVVFISKTDLMNKLVQKECDHKR